MEQAYEYAINVLNLIQTDVSGGKDRVDTPLFDSESFKEAWYNAVCHNLWVEKVPPAIYGFEDRIEIISHGLLREDLTKEDFYQGVSKPVNEEFADIFLKLHYMEQSGKVTSIIVKKYGEEVFNFGTSFIQCILPFNIVDKEKYYRMIGKDVELNDTVNDTVNLVLKLIKENPEITIEKLIEKTNKFRPTITRSIARLKKLGYIERVGPDKTGYWKIK